MSRERELLERAYQYIPMSSVTSQEIRAFLAEAEQEQNEEPVGILRHNGQFELQRMVGIPISQPMKLYEHPAPRPEFVRLSEEEIMAIVRADPDFDEMMWDDTSIRFARAMENRLVEKNK